MISWMRLHLAGSATLTFPNGTSASVELRQLATPLESRPSETAVLRFADGTSLELSESVDSSPNYDEPWLLVVSGIPRDKVLLFGGEISYVVSSEGTIVHRVSTFRNRRNSEFWRTEAVSLDDDDLLIVYEVGALLVGPNLEVRWQVEKALIDFYDRREGSELIFLRDHEVPFAVNLYTGHGVPPIQTN